jgi:hypothetical protein
MDIDLPEIVAEVRAAFARYERALVSNDVAVLDSIFHNDQRSIRYGVGENLYGYQEIEAFRAARSPIGLDRTVSKTVITPMAAISPSPRPCFTAPAWPARSAARCKPGSASLKAGEWWRRTSA